MDARSERRRPSRRRLVRAAALGGGHPVRAAALRDGLPGPTPRRRALPSLVPRRYDAEYDDEPDGDEDWDYQTFEDAVVKMIKAVRFAVRNAQNERARAEENAERVVKTKKKLPAAGGMFRRKAVGMAAAPDPDAGAKVMHVPDPNAGK